MRKLLLISTFVLLASIGWAQSYDISCAAPASNCQLTEKLNNDTATNAGLGYFNGGFPGTNGTSTNIMEWVDQTSGQIWNCSASSATFNSVIDDVSTCGWNQRGATQISTSWGSIFDQLEDSYVAASVQLLEHHMINIDTTGTQHRYFQSQFISSTGIDNFAKWGLNGGMSWTCLVASGSPCSTDGTTTSYGSISPTAGISAGFALPVTAGGNLIANNGATGTGAAPVGLQLLGGQNVMLTAISSPPSLCPGLLSPTAGVFYYPNASAIPYYCASGSSAAPVPMSTPFANAAGIYAYNDGGHAGIRFYPTTGVDKYVFPNSYTSDTNWTGLYIEPITNDDYIVTSSTDVLTLYTGSDIVIAPNYTTAETCAASTTICTFVNSPLMPTPTSSDSSTKGATTAFVKNQAYAPLASPTFTGTVTIPAVATTTNCNSSASPAVCGSAAAGSVQIPTGTTSETLTVNTTAVTANSQIFFYPDDSLGTRLGVTCNSTLATLVGGSAITARVAGTSFTITFNGTILTNGVCGSYVIVN